MGNLNQRSWVQYTSTFDKLGAIILVIPLIILLSLPHLHELYRVIIGSMQESRADQPLIILTPALMFVLCNLLLVGITAMRLLHQPCNRDSSIPSSLLLLPFKPMEVISLTANPISDHTLPSQFTTSRNRTMGKSNSYESLSSMKPAQRSLLKPSPSYNTFMSTNTQSLILPQSTIERRTMVGRSSSYQSLSPQMELAKTTLQQRSSSDNKFLPASAQNLPSHSTTNRRRTMGRSSSYESLASLKPTQRASLLQRSPSYSTFLPTESLSDEEANKRFSAFIESQFANMKKESSQG